MKRGKNYLNKSFLKKNDFFFIKYRQPKFKYFYKFFSKNFFFKNIFHVPYLKKKILFFENSKKNFNFIKVILMFNNLYFY